MGEDRGHCISAAFDRPRLPGLTSLQPAKGEVIEASGSYPPPLLQVLVYTSARLEEDLTVIGPVGVSLHAASSASDTDFTAKLCDVSPEGRSTNVQEGIVRARYCESLSDPTPITPEEVYESGIDLGSTAHVFEAGHRVRVQISSSDFPQWDRNLNTGGSLGTEGAARARVATQTVLHDAGHPSRVILPIVES